MACPPPMNVSLLLCRADKIEGGELPVAGDVSCRPFCGPRDGGDTWPAPVPAARPHPCSRRPPVLRQDVSVASRAIGGRRGWGGAEPLGLLPPPGPQGRVCPIPEHGGTGGPCPHRVSAQNARGDLRQGDLGMSLCLSASLTLMHTYTRTHTHVLTCMHTHIHTCLCTHTCTHMRAHTHTTQTHTHTRSHTCMYSHAHRHIHTCAHIQSCTCLHVYLHHIHVFTYTHIHTHTCAHAQAHTSPSAAPLPPVQTPNPQSLGTHCVRMQRGRLW